MRPPRQRPERRTAARESPQTTDHNPDDDSDHHDRSQYDRGQPDTGNRDFGKSDRRVSRPVPRQRVPATARDVEDPDIDAALDAVVAAAPPLPYEVRARLAWLLRGDATPGRRKHPVHNRARHDHQA